MLAGELGPVRDIVLLNAAAGISAFELAEDPELNRTPMLERLARSMDTAAATVDSGRAAAKLDEWVAATNA